MDAPNLTFDQLVERAKDRQLWRKGLPQLSQKSISTPEQKEQKAFEEWYEEQQAKLEREWSLKQIQAQMTAEDRRYAAKLPTPPPSTTTKSTGMAFQPPCRLPPDILQALELQFPLPQPRAQRPATSTAPLLPAPLPPPPTTTSRTQPAPPTNSLTPLTLPYLHATQEPAATPPPPLTPPTPPPRSQREQRLAKLRLIRRQRLKRGPKQPRPPPPSPPPPSPSPPRPPTPPTLSPTSPPPPPTPPPVPPAPMPSPTTISPRTRREQRMARLRLIRRCRFKRNLPPPQPQPPSPTTPTLATSPLSNPTLHTTPPTTQLVQHDPEQALWLGPVFTSNNITYNEDSTLASTASPPTFCTMSKTFSPLAFKDSRCVASAMHAPTQSLTTPPTILGHRNQPHKAPELFCSPSIPLPNPPSPIIPLYSTSPSLMNLTLPYSPAAPQPQPQPQPPPNILSRVFLTYPHINHTYLYMQYAPPINYY